MDFTGKVILITGASSGIGAGAGRFLANLGAKVALVIRTSQIKKNYFSFNNIIYNFIKVGRNAKRLNEVVEQIKKTGKQAIGIVADITITKDAQRMIDETIKHFGKLDVLINNAGTKSKYFFNKNYRLK